MRYAVMEYSDRGVDFVRIDGVIANFSYSDARLVAKKMCSVTGWFYSAVAIDDFNEPTMAADGNEVI